jgi:hypothetical protein
MGNASREVRHLQGPCVWREVPGRRDQEELVGARGFEPLTSRQEGLKKV